jgi:hypothetical protein
VKSSPREVPAIGDARRWQHPLFGKVRLTSTVTCVMMHVKDRGVIATMTDVLGVAVHYRACLAPIREGSGLSPWRPSLTP